MAVNQVKQSGTSRSYLTVMLSSAWLLSSCVLVPAHQTTLPAEISIFGINDFHGHVQSEGPVPMMLRDPDPQHSPHAAGGLSYLTSVVKQLRSRSPDSIVVGMGDLIGATPADSALLHDEPAIMAMNQLGMSVSALGNHELDIGPKAFKSLTAGGCAPRCHTPDYSGATYEYLAANVFDKTTQQPWLKPYAIRKIGAYRIGFIGAVTKTTPMIVRPSHTQNLRFEDEAEAINRILPEVKAQQVDAVVVLIHEGGDLDGAPLNLRGDCPSLRGAITQILDKLDPEIRVVMTGHTHQAYVCKIKDRWVVQGGSYGAYVSEVKLQADASGALRPLSATLHDTAHDHVAPDTDAATYVHGIQQLTSPIKNQVLGQLDLAMTRVPISGHGDSLLGKWVANAQLAFARTREPAVVAAFMNSGGIRTDIGVGTSQGQTYKVTQGDVFAMQPFRNELIALSLTGSELMQLLEQQAAQAEGQRARFLQPSSNLRYEWHSTAPKGQRVQGLTIEGAPVQAGQNYRIVVNNFIAEGGDGFFMLKRGRNPVNLGLDTDAITEALVRPQGSLADQLQGNIKLMP